MEPLVPITKPPLYELVLKLPMEVAVPNQVAIAIVSIVVVLRAHLCCSTIPKFRK